MTESVAEGIPETRGGGGDGSSAESQALLSWPPPGLARIQGDMYGTAQWLGAGAFLILPLLWAVVADQSPWELGPLGDTLWVAFVLGIVGIPILTLGHTMLYRLLGRAGRAAAEGYGWWTVALVAADQRRDTGFLLQGARIYSALTPGTRRSLAMARVLVASLLLGAALWLSLGFAIAVVVAARGLLAPAAVAGFTLLPSLAMLVLGAVVYSWEEGVLRRARKSWHGRPWRAELARADIRRWREEMEARHPESADRSRPERWSRIFTVARIGAAVATVVMLVPVFVLVFSSTISPIMAQIALPRSGMTQERAAELEPFRRLVLPPDPSIGAAEAGEIMNSLAYVGQDVPDMAALLPPAEYEPAPWFPRDEATPADARLDPQRWAFELAHRPGLALTTEEAAYLERVSAHPAHGWWSRVAGAAAADVVAGRYRLPFPEGVSMATLPLPRFGSLREGAAAHVASGVLRAARGDVAGGERAIREVVTVGFMLADQGPTLLDNLIGIVIAGNATRTLEALYGSLGRTAEAEAMRLDREAGSRTAERARIGQATDVSATLRAMPDVALDERALRGLRWEYLILVNTVGPCLNLRQIVFGPGEEYELWLERVRGGLVRSPAEAELFEVAREGYFGAGATTGLPNVLTRIAGLTMGGSDRPGSCGRAMSQIVSSF